MPHSFGIIFAFIALLCWGFGDFFVQKSARSIGSWKTLFFIGIVGLVALFPLAVKEIVTVSASDLLLLVALGVVAAFASIFDFEALRKGKLSIIEPIVGLELPLTVALGMTLGKERLTPEQTILVLMVFVGITLAITVHHSHLHYRRMFEKGVILAGIGAVGIALTNFLVGVSSKAISPFVTIWFVHSFLALGCIVFLLIKGNFKSLFFDLRMHPGLIAGSSVLDNAAWLSFALATTFIPISIATTISESYIALACLLGIFVTRERLRFHQIAGILLVILGITLLSWIS